MDPLWTPQAPCSSFIDNARSSYLIPLSCSGAEYSGSSTDLCTQRRAGSGGQADRYRTCTRDCCTGISQASAYRRARLSSIWSCSLILVLFQILEVPCQPRINSDLVSQIYSAIQPYLSSSSIQELTDK